MNLTKLPSLDSMERIPLTDLPEKLDELLKRIDKENIAFVITENGNDKYVLCPYDWFDFARDNDFGCLINSAIRNELNHPSENTEAVQRFVKNHLNSFDHRTVSAAIEDIEYADRSGHQPLTNSESWLAIRDLLIDRLVLLQSKKERGATLKDNMETITIEVEEKLYEQLLEVITPMGLTPESLVQQFFAWCVNAETKEEAIAWLLQHQEETPT